MMNPITCRYETIFSPISLEPNHPLSFLDAEERSYFINYLAINHRIGLAPLPFTVQEYIPLVIWYVTEQKKIEIQPAIHFTHGTQRQVLTISSSGKLGTLPFDRIDWFSEGDPPSDWIRGAYHAVREKGSMQELTYTSIIYQLEFTQRAGFLYYPLHLSLFSGEQVALAAWHQHPCIFIQTVDSYKQTIIDNQITLTIDNNGHLLKAEIDGHRVEHISELSPDRQLWVSALHRECIGKEKKLTDGNTLRKIWENNQIRTIKNTLEKFFYTSPLDTLSFPIPSDATSTAWLYRHELHILMPAYPTVNRPEEKAVLLLDATGKVLSIKLNEETVPLSGEAPLRLVLCLHALHTTCLEQKPILKAYQIIWLADSLQAYFHTWPYALQFEHENTQLLLSYSPTTECYNIHNASSLPLPGHKTYDHITLLIDNGTVTVKRDIQSGEWCDKQEIPYRLSEILFQAYRAARSQIPLFLTPLLPSSFTFPKPLFFPERYPDPTSWNHLILSMKQAFQDSKLSTLLFTVKGENYVLSYDGYSDTFHIQSIQTEQVHFSFQVDHLFTLSTAWSKRQPLVTISQLYEELLKGAVLEHQSFEWAVSSNFLQFRP